MRLALLANIVEFENVFSRGGRSLPRAAQQRVQVAVEAAPVVYNVLSYHTRAAHTKRWHMIPNRHMVSHIGDDNACQANPRRVTCYADEDMVGLMVDIAESCHPLTLATTALFNWLHLMYDEGL